MKIYVVKFTDNETSYTINYYSNFKAAKECLDYEISELKKDIRYLKHFPVVEPLQGRESLLSVSCFYEDGDDLEFYANVNITEEIIHSEFKG